MTTRIAILSDIHGNRLALDAVLADIAAQGGVDATWILGDLCALGPQPVQALEAVAQIPNRLCVRGNTDRYLISGDRPATLGLAQVAADPSLLHDFAEMHASVAWTQGAVTAAGWLPFLRGLPLEERSTLADGTRVLLVHASPGTDAGSGVTGWMADEDARPLFEGCDADLVFVGHTHVPVDRQFTLSGSDSASHTVRVINPASVSNPRVPSLHASYGLLTVDKSGHRYQRREVSWDRQAILDLMAEIDYPGAEHVAEFLRGENVPPAQD